MSKKTGIFFNVNGKDVHEHSVDPELTLAYYLRNKLGIRGTKLGCEEGVCGSCTVVLGTWDNSKNKAHYRAVNACLVPLFHVHQTFIITIEGVGTRDKVHPIQERMAKGHALQCGFCSPGFVMSAYALLRNNPDPSIEEINIAVKANLCRCTGYRPILEALYSFSDAGAAGCCGGKKNGKCCKEDQDEGFEEKLLTFNDFPKYDPTQEIIFPPSLRTYVDSEETVILKGSRIEVAIPKTLQEFKNIIQEECVKVISSGLITRLIASNRPNEFSEKWVSTKYVEEFTRVEYKNHVLTIGSAINIKEFAVIISENAPARLSESITSFFDKYSSPQVGNFATWVGAMIMGAKSMNSVSDVLLLFFTMDWKLTVLKDDILVEVGIEEYVEQKLYNSTVVINAVIDYKNNCELFLYKTGESSHSDSTLFNFGARIIANERRFFAGVGGKPIELDDQGSLFDNASKFQITELKQNLKLAEPVRSKINYLIPALREYSKFVNHIRNDSDNQGMNYLQYFKPNEREAVGRPIENYFNERCITGEALFVNDIKAYDALHLGFVLSTVPNAEILSIDPSPALELEGVEGYIGIDDITGSNQPGFSKSNVVFPDDTTIFADGKVEAIGQIIGVIAANDVVLARRAAKSVKVEYNLLPAVIDFEEARKANSLLGKVQHFGKSEKEVDAAIENAEYVFEGEISIGGQEHYYMETQSSLAIPGEADEIIIHCSTQATSYTQLMVSEATGLPAHKIIVKTKRLGGAFGGKFTSSSWIASISAIVARKLNRPVYANLSRQEDLINTGKRHEVFAKYRVGVNDDGKIKGVHYKAYLNGGWSKDHSEGVTLVMGIKIDDVYDMENVRYDGYPVKTNTCSNTAFRGYGNPQGKLINEGIMRRISHELGIEMEQVKQINFLLEGGKNFMGQKLSSDALLECWEYCKTMSDYENRKEEVEKFNASSEHIKRGIAMSTCRFGLPHPGATSHGIASMLINLDGSIQLTIGGTEMGQGLNQKMLQVCSETINRPINTITVVDTSTDKITNAPETGGSQNSDTNGLAVIACCKRLLEGLQPLLDKNNGDWHKSVLEAFNSFIPLQCTEYGVVERQKFGVSVDDSPYNTTGACTVEIELDCLTGFSKIIRADIVMDVGESLNPAIDIGQIEGAFLQAYGLVTCEKVEFDSKTGKLVQCTAGKYKLPTVEMVPKDFRIKLLGMNKKTGAQVYSSKGIGEPPMMLATGGINSAIMKSIDSWRNQHNLTEFVETVSPLSAEKIMELCKY